MPTTLLDDQLLTRQGKQLPRSGFPVLCPPVTTLPSPFSSRVFCVRGGPGLAVSAPNPAAPKTPSTPPALCLSESHASGEQKFPQSLPVPVVTDASVRKRARPHGPLLPHPGALCSRSSSPVSSTTTPFPPDTLFLSLIQMCARALSHFLIISTF